MIYPPEPLRRHRRPRRRDPQRPAQPDRHGPAAGAAAPRHEAHDRVRRRQPVAAEDAPARQPPADHRGRARPRRRRRRRRHPHHRRPRPAPPDARVRAAPRARRPDRTTRSTPRDALPARRRGPRQPHRHRHHRRGRDRRDQQARRRLRPDRLRQRQPGGDGRRLEVDHHRPRQSTAACSHHHNPESLQNTRSLMGHREHSALHKSIWRMGKVLRDHGPKIFQIETTINTDTFPSPFDFLAQARVGVVAEGPRDLPRHREVARPHAEPGEAQDLPRHGGAVRDHQRAGRLHAVGARDHAQATSTTSTSSRSRARPTS